MTGTTSKRGSGSGPVSGAIPALAPPSYGLTALSREQRQLLLSLSKDDGQPSNQVRALERLAACGRGEVAQICPAHGARARRPVTCGRDLCCPHCTAEAGRVIATSIEASWPAGRYTIGWIDVRLPEGELRAKPADLLDARNKIAAAPILKDPTVQARYFESLYAVWVCVPGEHAKNLRGHAHRTRELDRSQVGDAIVDMWAEPARRMATAIERGDVPAVLGHPFLTRPPVTRTQALPDANDLLPWPTLTSIRCAVRDAAGHEGDLGTCSSLAPTAEDFVEAPHASRAPTQADPAAPSPDEVKRSAAKKKGPCGRPLKTVTRAHVSEVVLEEWALTLKTLIDKHLPTLLDDTRPKPPPGARPITRELKVPGQTTPAPGTPAFGVPKRTDHEAKDFFGSTSGPLARKRRPGSSSGLVSLGSTSGAVPATNRPEPHRTSLGLESASAERPAGARTGSHGAPVSYGLRRLTPVLGLLVVVMFAAMIYLIGWGGPSDEVAADGAADAGPAQASSTQLNPVTPRAGTKSIRPPKIRATPKTTAPKPPKASPRGTAKAPVVRPGARTEPEVASVRSGGGSPELEALRELLSDRNPQVRLKAVRDVRKLKNPEEALTVLAEALGDLEEKVREEAAQVLGQLGLPEAAPVLTGALGDSNKYVRLEAIEALGRIGDASAQIPLENAFAAGEDFRTRWKAAAALGRVGAGEEEMRETLREAEAMLSNPDRRQRQDAVRAVGDLSPPHEAVQLLERAAKDRHAAVRETDRRAGAFDARADAGRPQSGRAAGRHGRPQEDRRAVAPPSPD
ncbi:MAG: HEAT repeat domain-containing protein [Planctomycetota bacterium]